MCRLEGGEQAGKAENKLRWWTHTECARVTAVQSWYPGPTLLASLALWQKWYPLSRPFYHLCKATSPTSLKHTCDISAYRSLPQIYFKTYMLLLFWVHDYQLQFDHPNCQIPFHASLIGLLFQSLRKVSSFFFTHSKHYAPSLTNHFQWVTLSHNPQQKQRNFLPFPSFHPQIYLYL